MKKFMILARSLESPFKEVVQETSDILSEGGGQIVNIVSAVDNGHSDIEVGEDVDCIISIGGDGTLIRATGQISNYSVPFIGINAGHMGYLCEISRTELEDSLKKLLADDCRIQDRMMLEGAKASDLDIVKKTKALNDVVITKGSGSQSVLNLTVLINGSKLFTYDCDGLIFATPTGSTAYNLSANGPIVNPTTSCIILTPLNPHTLNSRSIILDSNDNIEVVLNRRRDDMEETAVVFFDGNEGPKLHPTESLLINRAEVTTKMVHVKGDNFLDRIRSKMQETVV